RRRRLQAAVLRSQRRGRPQLHRGWRPRLGIDLDDHILCVVAAGHTGRAERYDAPDEGEGTAPGARPHGDVIRRLPRSVAGGSWLERRANAVPMPAPTAVIAAAVYQIQRWLRLAAAPFGVLGGGSVRSAAWGTKGGGALSSTSSGREGGPSG